MKRRGGEIGRGRRAGIRASAAFSLVEIFVAVGVIAILTALVIPAASRQLEQGRSTACLAALRNLAGVMGNFRADRDQRLWNRSSAAEGGEGDVAPARAFYRQGVIGSARELRCPAAVSGAQGAWQTGGTGTQDYMDNIANQHVSYAVNAIAFYQSSPYMMSSTPITTFWHFSGHESRTPLFMDGTYFQLNDSTWRKDERFARLALRHNERCNVLFLDGHAESMTREAVGRIDPYGGTNPRWWSDFGGE